MLEAFDFFILFALSLSSDKTTSTRELRFFAPKSCMVWAGKSVVQYN